MSDRQQDSEYIIEFLQHGNAVKVSAFDAASLVEVSIVGSAKASKAELQHTAIRKLQYVLEKKRKDQSSTPATSARGRGGIIV